jgi:hypothetical protein
MWRDGKIATGLTGRHEAGTVRIRPEFNSRVETSFLSMVMSVFLVDTD